LKNFVRLFDEIRSNLSNVEKVHVGNSSIELEDQSDSREKIKYKKTAFQNILKDVNLKFSIKTTGLLKINIKMEFTDKTQGQIKISKQVKPLYI